MEWKLKPKEGIEAFITQSTCLVLRNAGSEDGDGVCIEEDQFDWLIDVIEQARAAMRIDAECEREAHLKSF